MDDKDKPKLTVVDFPVPSIDNIPARFRKLADMMDSGEIPTPKNALVVADELTDLEIYAYGPDMVTRSYVCLMLDMAKHKMMLHLYRQYGYAPPAE